LTRRKSGFSVRQSVISKKNIFSTYQVENSLIVYFIQFGTLCKENSQVSMRAVSYTNEGISCSDSL